MTVGNYVYMVRTIMLTVGNYVYMVRTIMLTVYNGEDYTVIVELMCIWCKP